MEALITLAAVAAALWLALMWLSDRLFDTVRVRTPNVTDERLTAVVEEMKRRGRPVLRAYWVPEEQLWQLVEGSHRTTAAVRLGCGVEIHELPPNATVGNTDTGHPTVVRLNGEWVDAPPDWLLSRIVTDGPIYEIPARKCHVVRWRPVKPPLQVLSLQFWKRGGVQ